MTTLPRAVRTINLGGGVTVEQHDDKPHARTAVTFTIDVPDAELMRVGAPNVLALAVAKVINALDLDKADAVEVVRPPKPGIADHEWILDPLSESACGRPGCTIPRERHFAAPWDTRGQRALQRLVRDEDKPVIAPEAFCPNCGIGYTCSGCGRRCSGSAPVKPDPNRCRKCEGTGKQLTWDCPRCGGTGINPPPAPSRGSP